MGFSTINQPFLGTPTYGNSQYNSPGRRKFLDLSGSGGEPTCFLTRLAAAWKLEVRGSTGSGSVEKPPISYCGWNNNKPPTWDYLLWLGDGLSVFYWHQILIHVSNYSYHKKTHYRTCRDICRNDIFNTMNTLQTNTGWWFEPVWKILVHWDAYSQYMGK